MPRKKKIVQRHDFPEDVKAKYVASGGSFCPYCNDQRIYFDHSDLKESCFVNAYCENCGKQWQERHGVVELISIE